MQIKQLSDNELIFEYEKYDKKLSLLLAKQKGKSMKVKDIPETHSKYFDLCGEINKRGLK